MKKVWTSKRGVAIIGLTTKRGGDVNVMYLTLLGLLICAVYTDLTQTKISNRLIVTGLLLGLILRMIGEGSISILVYIVNISIPVIFLHLLFQMRALGAGDIKLFSMVGAFLSTEQLVQIVGLSFCIAAAAGIVKLAYQWIFSGKKREKKTLIHFSPAILTAYIIIIWR